MVSTCKVTPDSRHSLDRGKGRRCNIQAEADEDNMGEAAVTGTDDFKEGVGVGSPTLQLDGDSGEEDDLHGCARGVLRPC